MKHEQILQEIDDQLLENKTRRMCCSRQAEDDVLRNNNNLLGKIKTILKSADKEYERGCEDAWALCKKLWFSSDDGGFRLSEISKIFGAGMLSDIMRRYSAKEALAKVEACEKKKKEEEAEVKKIVVGDVVECVYKYNNFHNYKGIVRGIDDSHIYILTKEHTHITCLLKSEFDIKKTGKHIDILGMLDEITED